MEVYLDDALVLRGNYAVQTVDLKVNSNNLESRLYISLDDGCDIVSGYFRSVEDIEKVILELRKYVDEVKK